MKILLTILGLISLGLGILGIFLPVLPTTPLLLLSAFLFLRSNRKLYEWLMNHPKLGPYISNFLHHKTIPLKIKIISISTLDNLALLRFRSGGALGPETLLPCSGNRHHNTYSFL